ncbi:MAG: hypothetical protein AAGA99_19220 [Actinomycetota bacterium]
MAAVAAEYEGRVNFVGVAGSGNADSRAAFVDEVGVGNMPHIADVDGTIWTEFDVFYQPAFAFIDDSGRIESFVSSFSADELREKAEELLAG